MKRILLRRSTALAAVLFPALAWALTCTAGAQQAPSPAQASPNAATAMGATENSMQQGTQSHAAESQKNISSRDRRRAAKLFLEATKLFEKEQFDQAMKDYEQAAALDPTNADYSIAAKVARQSCGHCVDSISSQSPPPRRRRSLARRTAEGLRTRPQNPQIAEHLHELADTVIDQSKAIYEDAASTAGESPVLVPDAGIHSFHFKTDQRGLIQNVFRAYGIEATVDQSVPATPARLDLDDVTFKQAIQALSLVTQTFWVPLDAHRALLAKDTRVNRDQFLRQEMETVYLPGLTSTEMTEVSNLAKNVFDAQHSAIEQTSGTMTIRAPTSTLNAFNATLHDLLDGHSQVLLEVKLIQIAHNSERNTGAQLPQQITAFNVYAEEQAILNANQSLVQQIISSGLAAPGDTLAILGILLASGQVLQFHLFKRNRIVRRGAHAFRSIARAGDR